mgnify:CR=1 FL=1
MQGDDTLNRAAFPADDHEDVDRGLDELVPDVPDGLIGKARDNVLDLRRLLSEQGFENPLSGQDPLEPAVDLDGKAIIRILIDDV